MFAIFTFLSNIRLILDCKNAKSGGWVRKFFSVFSWGKKIFCLNFMGMNSFWYFRISLRLGTDRSLNKSNCQIKDHEEDSKFDLRKQKIKQTTNSIVFQNI